MPSIDAALKMFEVLAALHALPDKAALTTAEAALFLRLSPKTMERMRLDGTGPDYIQGGGPGASGTNQKCLYFKESLLAWQHSNQVSNAMQAAMRKGQAFMSISDLARERPFYINETDLVVAAAEDTQVNVAIERLGSKSYGLIWMPMVEAAAREWLDMMLHRTFALPILGALNQDRQRISAALDATEIRVEMDRKSRAL